MAESTSLTWASPTALKCAKHLCARQEGDYCGSLSYCKPAMFFSLPAGSLDSELSPEKPRVYCRTRLDKVAPAPVILLKNISACCVEVQRKDTKTLETLIAELQDVIDRDQQFI